MDTHLLRELVLDASEMRELLPGYFGELDWTRGAIRDDLVAHLAGRDEALRFVVDQGIAEGACQSLDDVMNVLPALSQLTGKRRSKSRNQLPCITAATSSSRYPRFRSKSGIFWTSAMVSRSLGVCSMP